MKITVTELEDAINQLSFVSANVRARTVFVRKPLPKAINFSDAQQVTVKTRALTFTREHRGAEWEIDLG